MLDWRQREHRRRDMGFCHCRIDLQSRFLRAYRVSKEIPASWRYFAAHRLAIPPRRLWGDRRQLHWFRSFEERLCSSGSRGSGTITHVVKDGRLVPKSPKPDLETEALEALEKARALPHGPERAEALKKV